MTKREVASLAFTIAGVYALIEACKYLTLFGTLLQALSREAVSGGSVDLTMRPFPLIVAHLPLPVLAAVGYFLITRGGRFAAKLSPDTDTQSQAPCAGLELATMVFAAAGVILAAAALPAFLAQFASFFSRFTRSPIHVAGSLVGLIGVTARMALGLALLFWAKPIAQWWSSFSAPKWIDMQWQKVRPLSGVREDDPTDTEG
ncbi:MAG: hypothetical protein ABIF82_06570 [Planctomycetota bacterium]